MAKTVRHKPPPSRRPATSPPKRPAAKRSTETEKGYLGKSALAIALFGPSGVGKTAWAAHFPNVGFIHDPQEPGIVDLFEYNAVPEPTFIEEVGTFNALLKTCENIVSGKLKCSTVVFDSLTGMEKLCFQHHCREYFNNDWTKDGFYSFFQGPRNAAKTDWTNYIDALSAIQAVGVNVVLLGHSQVKPYSNPEGADYDRFIPYLDKETWQAIHRWAKAVLFYNYHVELDKKGLKNKARESDKRFIYTQWSPAYDAKNRYNLPPFIEAGNSGEEAYANFEAAFRKVLK